MNVLSFTVASDTVSVRIDRYLTEQCPELSRSYIQKLLKDQKVKADHKTVKANYKVQPGQEIVVEIPDAEPLDIQPEDIPLDILYEDPYLLVVNKPKGMVVHPAAGHTGGTLVNAVMAHCGENLSGINGVLRPGIVHRIDKDTTGALLVCKTDEVHRSLAEQLKELLANMPLEHAAISNDIIAYAKEQLKLRLNQSIYVTLTDHINFAIERIGQGIKPENALLWEIKQFYPQEFRLGQYAVELIKERLGMDMPEDEAGFIALHFVNAEYGTDIRDALNFPNLMKEILEIAQESLQIELDESTLHYERFVTHVKFLLQRIYRRELLTNEEKELVEMMQKKYPREYACSRRIADYIEQATECKLSGEEVMYLAIHIRRVTMAEDATE